MKSFNKKRKPKHSTKVRRTFGIFERFYLFYQNSKNESRIDPITCKHVIKKRYRLGYEFIRMSKAGDDK